MYSSDKWPTKGFESEHCLGQLSISTAATRAKQN